jgi:hypothetical protein
MRRSRIESFHMSKLRNIIIHSNQRSNLRNYPGNLRPRVMMIAMENPLTSNLKPYTS